MVNNDDYNILLEHISIISLPLGHIAVGYFQDRYIQNIFINFRHYFIRKCKMILKIHQKHISGERVWVG